MGLPGGGANGGHDLGPHKRLERSVHIQPSISRHSRRRALIVDRVRPRIAVDDVKALSAVPFLLPLPEHLVDEAVMEVEDRIKARSIVLSHVPVCPWIMVVVDAGNLEAT